MELKKFLMLKIHFIGGFLIVRAQRSLFRH